MEIRNIFFSLFAVLLLVSFGFAFDYALPSCYQTTSIFGINITLPVLNNTILDCESEMWVSQLSMNGTNLRNSTGFNATHFQFVGGSSGSQFLNLKVPAYTTEIRIVNAGDPFTGFAPITVVANRTASFTINCIGSSPCAGGGDFVFNHSGASILFQNKSSGATLLSFNSGDSLNVQVSCTGAFCGANPGSTAVILPMNYTTSLLFESFNNKQVEIPNFYSSYNGYVLRSDVSSTPLRQSPNSSNTFKALLYYQTEQISTLITYVANGTNSKVYPAFRNMSDNTALLYNNTVTYIYDENFQQWFTVPAISVTNLNEIQTISVILTSGQQSAGNITAPLIPNKLSCTQSGNIWTINSSWTQVVDHHVSFWNATNFNQTTSSASSFFYQINVSDYPNANYTVNGNLQCALSNQTTLLGLPRINMEGVSSTFFFLQLMFIASIGLSVFVPFGLFFAIAYNDVFQILEPVQMALLSTVVMMAAVFVNARDMMNLKTIILYALMLIAILTSIYPTSGRSTDSLDSLTSSFQSVVTTSPINLWDFVAASATFIISLGEFLLNLPSYIGSVMLEPLSQSSPIMASAVAVFVNTVQLGFYAYLAIKLYEVISNRFRDV